MAKKRKKKKVSTLVGIVLCIFIIVAVGNVFADFFGMSGKGEARIRVESGETAGQIAEKLKESGIISSKTLFQFSSKIGGWSAKFKTGMFVLDKGASYFELCEKLSTAPVPEGSVWVTIPEGYELRQIADKLVESGIVDREKFYDEVENGEFEYSFLSQIPKRENRLEGYLFPDTYLFSANDSEHAVINAMLKRFDEKYSDEYKTKAEKLGMTFDEVITLASIIEREALGDEDRRLVSSVFHNRLKSNEMPYLQSCATVQYILKERKTVLSVSDTKIDSPYNTYINKGLPLGPIASPGEEAIYAALYPEKSDYLFFVLDSTGKHRFAKTYNEHLKNQKK